MRPSLVHRDGGPAPVFDYKPSDFSDAELEGRTTKASDGVVPLLRAVPEDARDRSGFDELGDDLTPVLNSGSMQESLQSMDFHDLCGFREEAYYSSDDESEMEISLNDQPRRHLRSVDGSTNFYRLAMSKPASVFGNVN
jgi:hypothetical protein